MNTDFYEQLRSAARNALSAHGLLQKKVVVTARALSPEEAIGNPESDDFPIQKGKERLMQAEIEGFAGQAFTDRFGDYRGTLEEILATPLTNNYRRAIFVAAINAALRSVGLIENTVHCRDQGPKACGEALGDHLQKHYGAAKIVLIGFQPAMTAALFGRFALRVLDMDPDNIGRSKYGVLIESPENTAAAIAWADLLLVTGTTLVNGTLPEFLGKKPVIFYGTTIAGAAHLMGLERFCVSSI